MSASPSSSSSTNCPLSYPGPSDWACSASAVTVDSPEPRERFDLIFFPFLLHTLGRVMCIIFYSIILPATDFTSAEKNTDFGRREIRSFALTPADHKYDDEPCESIMQSRDVKETMQTRRASACVSSKQSSCRQCTRTRLMPIPPPTSTRQDHGRHTGECAAVSCHRREHVARDPVTGDRLQSHPPSRCG